MGASAPAPKAWPWSLWALENREFVALNGMVSLLRFAVQRPAQQTVDMYSDGSGPLPEMRGVVIRQIRAGVAAQATYFQRLARFAAQLQTLPHVSVVFLEEPLAPSLIAEGDLGAALATFRADLVQLATETNAEAWLVVSEADLTDTLYYDDIHIKRGEAQQRLRLAMVEHMSRMSHQLEPLQ